MIEHVRKYITERRLVQPGERIAAAVSGGADSVALLRALLELREDLGIVLSVAHFHHGIRGAEADADQKFVAKLAAGFDLELYSGASDAPAHARERGMSLETAARELRHHWFSTLLTQGRADKVATAHNLDDQAETVLMRLIRGAGARGVSGIAPSHSEKGLIRPFLEISRTQIESYLRGLGQPWREDLSNKDLKHTRNRIRHELLPLLEREFNPAIRQTLADLAEISRAETEYWDHEIATVLPRLLRPGKPSRSGRSTSGAASGAVALDLAGMKGLPLAVQRQVLHRLAAQLGTALEFKHIQELTSGIQEPSRGKRIALPSGIAASFTFRELQFTQGRAELVESQYVCSLAVPGQVHVSALGSTIRASVINPSLPEFSGYNPALLLDRARIQSDLVVRNWRPGDRFWPAHAQSAKKVKELLQPARLGRSLVPAERQNWPVIESAGQIVWLRGFPVADAFAYRAGDAILIEEVENTSGAE